MADPADSGCRTGWSADVGAGAAGAASAAAAVLALEGKAQKTLGSDLPSASMLHLARASALVTVSLMAMWSQRLRGEVMRGGGGTHMRAHMYRPCLLASTASDLWLLASAWSNSAALGPGAPLAVHALLGGAQLSLPRNMAFLRSPLAQL